MPPPIHAIQQVQPSLPPPVPSTTHPLYKTPPSPPSSTSSSPKISPHSSPLSSPSHQSTLKRKRQSKKNLHAPDYGFSINFPIIPINVSVPNDQMPLVPSPSSIAMKKYSTAVDSRKFLTVYEFMVNNQWIIWDYHTGYVHLTGLWKAIGNNKADIVKLIENSPELEPDIKRVRGGYLKIQGTWVPFEIAKALAARTCYFIRYALIPLFGNDFPESCLKPNEPGFGQLQMRLTDPATKRRRRKRSVNILHQQPQRPIRIHQHQPPIHANLQHHPQSMPMSMQHQQPSIHPMPMQHQQVPVPFTHPSQYMFKPPIHLPSPPHISRHDSEEHDRAAKRSCLSHSYSFSNIPNSQRHNSLNKEEIHLPSIRALENSPSFKSQNLPPILPPIINPEIANQKSSDLPSEVLEATRSLQQLSAGVGLGISGVSLQQTSSPSKSNWSFDSQDFKQVESNLRSTPSLPQPHPLKSSVSTTPLSNRLGATATSSMDSKDSKSFETEKLMKIPQTPETLEKTKRAMDISGLLS